MIQWKSSRSNSRQSSTTSIFEDYQPPEWSDFEQEIRENSSLKPRLSQLSQTNPPSTLGQNYGLYLI